MKEKIVYVIQEIPGTQSGTPKINIMGASKYGEFKYLVELPLFYKKHSDRSMYEKVSKIFSCIINFFNAIVCFCGKLVVTK